MYSPRPLFSAGPPLRRETRSLDLKHGQRRCLPYASLVLWSTELIAVFDRSLFDEIKVAMDDKLTRAAEDPLIKQDENLQLEQDVIVPLAAARKVYVFETTDFWRQMKTAAYVFSSLALN